jgi:hypothetical protein
MLGPQSANINPCTMPALPLGNGASQPNPLPKGNQMSTKEQADREAVERIYGRMLPVSAETSESLSKIPGATLDEKLLILNERVNDLTHALDRIVKAFDAPHRFPMLPAVVKARELLAALSR